MLFSDVDEDGEKITVRSDDELKAMFQMVNNYIFSLTCISPLSYTWLFFPFILSVVIHQSMLTMTFSSGD
jgi:hypothetical protein